MRGDEMAYKIRYDFFEPKSNAQYDQKGLKKIVKVIFIAAIILLLLLPTYKRGVLKEWLIPGNADVTVQAAESLVSNLRNGTAFKDAIVVFCKEIIENEALY